MVEAKSDLFGEKITIDHILYPQGEQLLRAGLEFFCGKNYTWNPAYKEIAKWLGDNKSKGLLLIGNCGVGKTLITRKILLPFFNQYYRNTFKQNGMEVKFYPAYDLERAVKSGLGDCVVIDDIGSENIQNNFGNKVDWFSRAVDYAEQHGNMLICTSNLPSDMLQERYGARTFDRMNAILHPIVIKGQSLRK